MQASGHERVRMRWVVSGAAWFAAVAASGCEPTISVRELALAANGSGALVADRQLTAAGPSQSNKVEAHHLRGSDGAKVYWNVAIGLDSSARLLGAGAGAEDGSASAAFAVMVSGEGGSSQTHVHGDPHVDQGGHGRWDLMVPGSTGTAALAPVSFDGFRAVAVTEEGLQEYEIDRETGDLGAGPLYRKAGGSSLGSPGNFGGTAGLNGGDMVNRFGVTPDCATGGNADRCKTEVVLNGKLVEGSQSVGRPEGAWSDGTGHLSFARSFDRTLVLEGSFGFRGELAANDGCTAAGFDLDGTPLAVRVTPEGAELLEGTKAGFVPTAWSEARTVDADLDGDGWFDTSCAIAPYLGDVWVAWVERDPATGEHGNIEVRKVVEKATSGLRDTLKTQV